MKLACTNLMLPKGTLTEQASLLKTLGFDGIAVFAEYETWNDELLKEIVELERKTGVKPCEFAFSSPIYGHLMDKDEDLRQKARKMYVQAVRICAEIGAVTEVEFSYGPQAELPLFSPYKKMTQSEESEFIDMYRNLLGYAEGSEAFVLIEGINRYETPYMNSLDDCTDIVKKTGHPNAGVLADFFHMSIEEANLQKSIIKTGNLIKHVHLGDNNRLLPGSGSIDWVSCINALKEVGYKGYLNLECAIDGEISRLEETVKFLKGLIV